MIYDDDARDRLDEMTVGVTTWALDDHLKWQVDVGALGQDDRTDWRLRAQLQLRM